MPEWVSDFLTPAGVGLLTLIVAIAYLLRKLWPVIHGFTNLMDDWRGEPARPGVPARTGVMENVSLLRAEVEVVRNQVQNSHRTNFRDDLDNVEYKVDEVYKQIGSLNSKLDEHISITAERRETAAEVTTLVKEQVPYIAVIKDKLEDLTGDHHG